MFSSLWNALEKECWAWWCIAFSADDGVCILFDQVPIITKFWDRIGHLGPSSWRWDNEKEVEISSLAARQKFCAISRFGRQSIVRMMWFFQNTLLNPPSTTHTPHVNIFQQHNTPMIYWALPCEMLKECSIHVASEPLPDTLGDLLFYAWHPLKRDAIKFRSCYTVFTAQHF